MSHDIFLFGSIVRGEVSETSDVDVLVIPTSSMATTRYPPDWSVYQRDTIAGYFTEGRLFAWHLHLESRCVHSAGPTNWLEKLGTPAPYQSAQRDVSALTDLLEESLAQLTANSNRAIYELGLCYTALRDIAMAASWKRLGAPSFSRYAPYLLPEVLPLDRNVYEDAMIARHFSTRGGNRPSEIDASASALLEAPVVAWAQSLRDSL